jgi:hypothetical protein
MGRGGQRGKLVGPHRPRKARLVFSVACGNGLNGKPTRCGAGEP